MTKGAAKKIATVIFNGKYLRAKKLKKVPTINITARII
jgi:hypothetical protein